MASIRLDAISKSYRGGPAVLREIDLEIHDGELLVLVGPSGCGKSTALRIVAGLESPTRGRVWIGDRDVTQDEPGERDVAMVFQSYALYPHKSVRENIGFGLRMRREPADEIERRVDEVAARLGLEAVIDRRPAALSGGQRQRVALGRAIARCGDPGPSAVLLDEPLSNLDAKLRLETRAELGRLHRELGVTMIYVTHDQEEAMTLGDRIAVLQDGGLEQVAPPLDVYRRPATVFVADFIGVPPMNWFRGCVEKSEDGLRVRTPECELTAPEGLPVEPGDDVKIGVRPHDVDPVPPDQADLRGRVDVLEALGSVAVAHVRAESGAVHRAVVPADRKLAVGDPIGLALRSDRLHVFETETGRRLTEGI